MPRSSTRNKGKTQDRASREPTHENDESEEQSEDEVAEVDTSKKRKRSVDSSPVKSTSRGRKANKAQEDEASDNEGGSDSADEGFTSRHTRKKRASTSAAATQIGSTKASKAKKAKDSDEADFEENGDGSDDDGEVNASSSPNKGKRMSTSSAVKASKPKKGKAKAEKDDDEDDDDEDGSLFEMVKRKAATETILRDLFKNVEDNKTEVIVQLVNFVIRSSGSKDTISEDDLEKTDEEVVELLKEYTLNNDAYPIVSKSGDMKKFRASFSEFWKKSAAKIPRDLLVDGSFVATLLHWLINMCASGLRPFRHTAMIAVYRFADSLIARDFHDAASKAARVAKSTTGKKSSEDAKSLTRAASVVDGYLNEIFNVVFQNRFRDISEEIRIDSVVALGDWVIKHPPLFLDNTRLKYIGWMLSDTSAVVRRAAVGVIEKLFQRDEFAPQLEKFATYYRKRLVAMVLDKDSQTAAEAIRVIGFLHKNGVISNEDTESIFNMISDDNVIIRNAVASFAIDYYFGAKSKQISSKKQLHTLVDFMENRTKHPDHPNYVVDSFWGKKGAEFLRDFQAMSELLSADDSKLSDSERALLAHVVLSCVLKATGQKIVYKSHVVPFGRDKDEEKRQELVNDMATVLTKTLPEILGKYKNDAAVIEALAEIPQYIPLDAYTMFRHQSSFKELVAVLSESFLKVVNVDVFRCIAKTFAHVLDEHALRGDAEKAFKELLDEVLVKFRTAFKKGGAPLITSLQRLAALAAPIDLERKEDELWDNLTAIISARISQNNGKKRSSSAEAIVPDDAASLALEICYDSLCWLLKRTAPSKDADESESDSEDGSTRTRDAKLLEDRSLVLIKHLEQMIADPADAVRQTAFCKLCDSLVLCSPAWGHVDRSMASIAYTATPDMLNLLKEYYELSMASPTDPEDIDEIERKHYITTRYTNAMRAGVIPFEYAPFVLIHYMKHGKQISELVKTFLTGTLRKHLKQDSKIIVQTLKIQFEAIQVALESETTKNPTKKAKSKKSTSDASNTSSNIDDDEDGAAGPASDSAYEEFRKLAFRLASTYGISGQNRPADLRQSLVDIIVKGLTYALEKPAERAAFVADGLSQFVSKLDATVAGAIRDRLENVDSPIGRPFGKLDEDDEASKPFFDLKAQLTRISSGEKKSPKKAGPAKKAVGAKKSGRGKKLFADDSVSVSEKPAKKSGKKIGSKKAVEPATPTRSRSTRAASLSATKKQKAQIEREDEEEEEEIISEESDQQSEEEDNIEEQAEQEDADEAQAQKEKDADEDDDGSAAKKKRKRSSGIAAIYDEPEENGASGDDGDLEDVLAPSKKSKPARGSRSSGR